MIDKTDIEILKELKKNCRIKENQLSKKVHLSAPAVSSRIHHMEERKVIRNYTIEVDPSKLGYTHQVFIQTEMTYQSHQKYLEFIHQNQHFILHHFRTSGQYNYLIQGGFHSNEELNEFLVSLNKYANYKVFDIISDLTV